MDLIDALKSEKTSFKCLELLFFRFFDDPEPGQLSGCVVELASLAIVHFDGTGPLARPQSQQLFNTCQMERDLLFIF